MYYQAVVSGYEKEIPTANIKAGLEVNREYIKDSLSSDKSKDIKVGDTIIVKISFRSTGGTLRNIALVDLSPAGFEADIESIRESDNSWKPDYVDVREDRVVIYGTVTDKINTFTYKAKAVNSGKFVVPPMFAESMYNKDIRALSVYKPIEIAPAK